MISEKGMVITLKETIGIVLGTYNGERFLREQIDSILKNTVTNWILEICDDGSTDKTVEIAKEYVKLHPEKIRVHKNNKNLGVTLNFLEGAKRFHTQYIMFCDQDDIWLPDKIEHAIKCMKRMEKKYGREIPISVFADAKVVDVDLNCLYPSFYQSSHLNRRKVDLPHILMENKLLGCTILFNGALKGKLMSLPEKARVHDWWIGLIGAALGRIGYVKEVDLLYRQHGSNVIGNKNFKDYVKGCLLSMKKQKEALTATQKQAENFFQLFGNEIPENEKIRIYQFAHLSQHSFFIRKYKVIRYGFFKTGLIRNIGVLLLV